MDAAALSSLIAERVGDADASGSVQSDRSPKPAGRAGSPVKLTAYQLSRLSERKCLDLLGSAGVQFTRPGFSTPGVATPVLLEGPVRGVAIRPHVRRRKPINEVMDCRLALAMVRVAEVARTLQLEELILYSSYRPPKKLKKCKKGRAGKKCRRRNQRIRRRRTVPSQHRLGLAIDLRWLVTANGEKLDVLEHFDRRSKTPPCSYTASTTTGIVLQRFACELHRKKVFNVVLTPNANRAHHNHFHFDITGNVKWYIIR